MLDIELDLSPEVCRQAVQNLSDRHDAVEMMAMARSYVEFHAMVARLWMAVLMGSGQNPDETA